MEWNDLICTFWQNVSLHTLSVKFSRKRLFGPLSLWQPCHALRCNLILFSPHSHWFSPTHLHTRDYLQRPINPPPYGMWEETGAPGRINMVMENMQTTKTTPKVRIWPGALELLNSGSVRCTHTQMVWWGFVLNFIWQWCVYSVTQSMSILHSNTKKSRVRVTPRVRKYLRRT